MSSLFGGGVCPLEGGGGCLPSLPWWGGEGEGGYGTSTLVTCLGSQGTLCPCSSLMIRVGRPRNLLLLLMGPGPISLMHSARSNKSSSEGDTLIVSCILFCCNVPFSCWVVWVCSFFPFFLPFRSPVFFFSCQSFSPFPVSYSITMLPRLSTFSTSTFFLFLLLLFIKFSCFIFCFYVALSFSTSIWGLFLVLWHVAPPFLPPMVIDPSPELVLTMY